MDIEAVDLVAAGSRTVNVGADRCNMVVGPDDKVGMAALPCSGSDISRR